MRKAQRFGQLCVAAASGLVLQEGRLYVVADEDTTLAVHRWPELTPLGRVALLARDLPAEPDARKAHKPDFEALVALPGGSLLALGSGSTAARHVGALVSAGGEVRAVDLAPLHAHLLRQFPELNLEGAAVTGDVLALLQRGNGPRGENAVISLDLAATLAALTTGRPLGPELVRAIAAVDLGELRGARLGFTDATALPDGQLLFAAAAERSPDTYHDGVCEGSALGIVDLAGLASRLEVLDLEPRTPIPSKIEGVAIAARHADALDLILCADDDTPGVPAPLFTLRWPL